MARRGRIRPAKDALDSMVAAHTLLDPEGDLVSSLSGEVAWSDNFTVIKIKEGKHKGKVAFIGHGFSPVRTIRGYIRGYNMHAVEIAYLLVSIGVVKEEDASAFSDWYFRTRNKLDKDSAEEAAAKRLRQAGYTVTKE